ncbi:MAG TPA: hypothetical protein PLO67_14325 [Saprospiraceae bacterium]|nr:hypothetical protein [Saprospiraceae bacterium]
MQNTRFASGIYLILSALLLLVPAIISAQWVQIGQSIDGNNPGDLAGYSVSLSKDGTRIIIGARKNGGNGTESGQAIILELDGVNWLPLGNALTGEAAGDQFGYAVAISGNGNRIAVGAVLNDGNGANSGHVRVFEFDGLIWVQLGNDINGEAAGDEFGRSVALSDDGSILAVGAIQNDDGGNNAGHVRVFNYNGNDNAWFQIGSDINGQASGDNAGFSVSLSSDGDIVAVGAYLHDGNGTDAGQVRVFRNQNDNWSPMGESLDGEAGGDLFGTSVSLSSDGMVLAVGADHNDGGGANSGHARIFEYEVISNSWQQTGADIDGESAGDETGYAVSLSADGSRVAVGARRNDGNGNTDAGHVRVFQNAGMAWEPIGEDIDGNAAGDEFGCSVSLSANGTIVAIGAQANDWNGANAGQARVFGNSAPLPVELLDFQVTPTADANILFWQTGSEVQCHSFEIERSTNGFRFEKIGEIPAVHSGSDYVFKDHSPKLQDLYYRLKIKENNGGASYSNVVRIASARHSRPVIYPTLIKQTITIRGLISFMIFDISGRPVLTAEDVTSETWDVETLRPGQYLLYGKDEEGHTFSKFLLKTKE